ncbi:3-isopropylmalate dehydratase large subunit [Bordetella pertussis]|nr:3-isopropylmalate dehydratase large subunit [Bordetella pertussis]
MTPSTPSGAASAPPRTLFDRLWDSHHVADLPDGRSLIHIDRHLLHDLSSPQAFSALRAGPHRAQSGAQRGDRRPHRLHRARAARRTRGRQPGDDRCAGRQRRAHRHPPLRPGRPRPGHRARDRARTGPGAAGHDGGLWRQPHLDAGGAGRLGLGHRHLGGRACAGDPDPGHAPPARDAPDAARRPARRPERQGPDPACPAPARRARRGRGVPGAGRRAGGGALDGRTPDLVQHGHRGRRARRADRARRRDPGLPAPPCPRGARRRGGAGGVSRAAQRRRRALRVRARDHPGTAGAADDLGREPGPGRGRARTAA